MLLKRIEAPTLQKALDRVREECGDDALVVAIFRGDRLISRVPDGDEVLQVGDRVVTLAGPAGRR